MAQRACDRSKSSDTHILCDLDLMPVLESDDRFFPRGRSPQFLPDASELSRNNRSINRLNLNLINFFHGLTYLDFIGAVGHLKEVLALRFQKSRPLGTHQIFDNIVGVHHLVIRASKLSNAVLVTNIFLWRRISYALTSWERIKRNRGILRDTLCTLGSQPSKSASTFPLRLKFFRIAANSFVFANGFLKSSTQIKFLP